MNRCLGVNLLKLTFPRCSHSAWVMCAAISGTTSRSSSARCSSSRSTTVPSAAASDSALRVGRPGGPRGQLAARGLDCVVHPLVLLLHPDDQCVGQAGPLVQRGPDQLVLARVVGVQPVEVEADVLRHAAGALRAPGASTNSLACSNPRRMSRWISAISQGSEARGGAR